MDLLHVVQGRVKGKQRKCKFDAVVSTRTFIKTTYAPVCFLPFVIDYSSFQLTFQNTHICDRKRIAHQIENCITLHGLTVHQLTS